MGLFSIFSAKDGQNAARDQANGIRQGLTDATGAINTGLGNATTQYNNAQGYYSPLAGTANKAYSAYGDALGINGPEGNARATAAFQSNPGYQYQVNQAIQNADRGAAARGTLSSGGQQANELGIASNLANQNWNSYLSSFSPYLNQAPQIAAGQAGISTGLGNLNYDSGKTLGNLNYTAQTGIGNANAAGDMANYNASQNQWGAIFGGLGLGAQLLGGGAGGGGPRLTIPRIGGPGGGSAAVGTTPSQLGNGGPSYWG